MQQSREAEIEALKESISRLALAIRDAKPDGRDALKSSWASASGRLQTLGWSVVGPDPFDASVTFQEVAVADPLEVALNPSIQVPSQFGKDPISLKHCGIAESVLLRNGQTGICDPAQQLQLRLGHVQLAVAADSYVR